MLDPHDIPHFKASQAPSDKLGLAKQVLSGEKKPKGSSDQLNNTHLMFTQSAPVKPGDIFIRLPTKI